MLMLGLFGLWLILLWEGDQQKENKNPRGFQQRFQKALRVSSKRFQEGSRHGSERSSLAKEPQSSLNA